MTYHSRGRSIIEVVVAAVFVGFLLGFVVVLCIGNYYRAMRAMERQKQRRLAQLNGTVNNDGVVDSPHSHPSSSTAGSSGGDGGITEHNSEYTSLLPRQRRAVATTSVLPVEEKHDLLLFESTSTATTSAARNPIQVVRV